MEYEFLREEMLLGSEALERLRNCHVAVFGVGGVGSYAVEGLARAGIGELTLIDSDDVGISNVNRQLCALHSTIGKPKAQVMADRVRDINPNCKVHPMVALYTDADKERFFETHYDYIVDAIDLVSCKLSLIVEAKNREIPIISALGTGNKLDPSQFRILDLFETNTCPLARILRHELKKRGVFQHTVVWSPEEPKTPLDLAEAPPGRRSVPASVSWVPPVAGLMMSGKVITDLIK